MTKIVTASLAMRLADRGLLSLDQPVLPLVPELAAMRPRALAERITPRHLLTHSAGFANPIPVRWIHPADQPGPDQAALLTRLLARHNKIQFEPGTQSRYSNLSTLTLGQAIAKAAGAPYTGLVSGEILQPLGMRMTGFAYTPDMLARAATGYATNYHIDAVARLALARDLKRTFPIDVDSLVPASAGSAGDVRPCRSPFPARHHDGGNSKNTEVRIMRAVVVYESMYGNTHLIADAIGAGLKTAYDVRVVSVTQAAADVIVGADLVVVGGPTHAHGMSRASTRKAAVKAADQPVGGLTVEPDALGPGLRDWFGSLGRYQARAAAFDTRMHGPVALTGRASKGATRLLREHGFDVIAEPESFLLTKQDRLEPHEQDRARAWGASLATSVVSSS